MNNKVKERKKLKSRKQLSIELVSVFWFCGCASNVASLSHFPSPEDVDFERVDSSQSIKVKPHRFIYNCNFVNDYMLKIKPKKDFNLAEEMVKSLEKNEFKIDKKYDDALVAERGQTALEWGTIAVLYYKITDSVNYVYVRTEISQDETCGPEKDRAKPIVQNLCEKKIECFDIKELTKETRMILWPPKIQSDTTKMKQSKENRKSMTWKDI
jgi:hypothetical protein